MTRGVVRRKMEGCKECREYGLHRGMKEEAKHR